MFHINEFKNAPYSLKLAFQAAFYASDAKKCHLFKHTCDELKKIIESKSKNAKHRSSLRLSSILLKGNCVQYKMAVEKTCRSMFTPNTCNTHPPLESDIDNSDTESNNIINADAHVNIEEGDINKAEVFDMNIQDNYNIDNGEMNADTNANIEENHAEKLKTSNMNTNSVNRMDYEIDNTKNDTNFNLYNNILDGANIQINHSQKDTEIYDMAIIENELVKDMNSINYRDRREGHFNNESIEEMRNIVERDIVLEGFTNRKETQRTISPIYSREISSPMELMSSELVIHQERLNINSLKELNIDRVRTLHGNYHAACPSNYISESNDNLLKIKEYFKKNIVNKPKRIRKKKKIIDKRISLLKHFHINQLSKSDCYQKFNKSIIKPYEKINLLEKPHSQNIIENEIPNSDSISEFEISHIQYHSTPVHETALKISENQQRFSNEIYDRKRVLCEMELYESHKKSKHVHVFNPAGSSDINSLKILLNEEPVITKPSTIKLTDFNTIDILLLLYKLWGTETQVKFDELLNHCDLQSCKKRKVAKITHSLLELKTYGYVSLGRHGTAITEIKQGFKKLDQDRNLSED